jgi:hypothetical protein
MNDLAGKAFDFFATHFPKLIGPGLAFAFGVVGTWLGLSSQMDAMRQSAASSDGLRNEFRRERDEARAQRDERQKQIEALQAQLAPLIANPRSTVLPTAFPDKDRPKSRHP